MRVLGARIGAVLEKELHDLLLLRVRSFRAARTRRMRRDVERGRALPAVSRVDTSAALEQTANGLGTPRANRAMQRRRTRLLLVLDVRSRIEEALNHRPLLGRVPRLPVGPCIARVMQRGRTAPILGVRVGASFDQRPDGERPERRRGEMERRIPGV